MKLQIKTLNQKSLVIDIEDTKTVYDLKKELSLYPDVGVKPELQKIIYAGKVLVNEDKLNIYNIDVKKFLVIMILKQPLEELAKSTRKPPEEKEPVEDDKEKSKSNAKKEADTPEFKSPPTTGDQKKETLVAQIVDMGYPEADVRRALAASFYNPERAIQYLIEGIPTSPSTPEGEHSYSGMDTDASMTPLDIFRSDPMFQRLRNALQDNPNVIDQALQRIGETNPALLSLITENQEEFLSLLIEGSDDEDDDGEVVIAGDTEDEDD